MNGVILRNGLRLSNDDDPDTDANDLKLRTARLIGVEATETLFGVSFTDGQIGKLTKGVVY